MTEKKKVKDSNLETTDGEAAALASPKIKKVKKSSLEAPTEKSKEKTKKKKKRSLDGEGAADTSAKPPKKVHCTSKEKNTERSEYRCDHLQL